MSLADRSDRPQIQALSAAFVSAITTIVLVCLAATIAGHALWSLAVQIRTPLASDGAAVKVVEDALLLLIVGELLVSITQKADLVHELLLFLVIGVTALVRHGIAIVLGREVDTHAAGDLALNALAILVLAGAFILVQRLATPRGGSDHTHSQAGALASRANAVERRDAPFRQFADDQAEGGLPTTSPTAVLHTTPDAGARSDLCLGRTGSQTDWNEWT